MTDSRTVRYLLQAQTTGTPALNTFATSLERIHTVQDKLRSQGAVLQRLREQTAAAVAGAEREAAATRQALAEKQRAENEYSRWRGQQLQRDEAAEIQSQQRRRASVRATGQETTRLDALTQQAARGILNLTAQLARGAVGSEAYAQQTRVLGQHLADVSAQQGILSRETTVAEAALRKLNGVNLKQMSTAVRQEMAVATDATKAANTLRLAWQNNLSTNERTLQQAALMEKGYRSTITAIEAQVAALRAKGVLDEAETRRVSQLTVQQERYGQALRTLGSIQASINGTIQKGSLADGVQRGTSSSLAQIAASARQAAQGTKLLTDQQRVGLITNTELTTGLQAHVASIQARIVATQREILSLRELGVLDLQQTQRLAALTAANGSYTASLAAATAAQERQNVAQRASVGGALGVRGAGGMNNAAIAASFVSPELGMAAMAASMGPWVAAAAGIAGVVTILGDGVKKAGEFGQQMQQLKALTGESAEEINHYGQYVQQLSTQLPLTTKNLAELGRQGVLVGLHGSEGIQTYTQNMAALSIVLRDASGHTAGLEHVGQEVVKVLRSTGATTEEVNVGFGRMVNGLVALKTESGVAIPEVTSLLKFWSSQGAHVGLTIEQMTALSTALVQTGARAQGAGGALSTFYLRAAQAAAEGGPKLQKWADVLHLSAEAAADLLKKDPMEFMRRFVTNAVEMDHNGQALSLTLAGVGLKSQQVQRTFAELALAIPLVDKNLRIMTAGSNDSTLALRKAQEASKNYKDQVTMLGNAWDAFKTNMGGVIVPFLNRFLTDTLGPMSEKLLKFSQDLGKLRDNGPGDIRATLKIDWANDSGTTMAYKLLLGGVDGTKTILGNSSLLPLDQVQKLQTLKLQSSLQQAGLIDTPTSGDFLALTHQFDEINANLEKYRQMLSDYIKSAVGPGSAALRAQMGLDPLTGRPLGPVVTSQADGGVLTGSGPLLPGQMRLGPGLAQSGAPISGLAAVGFMGLAGRTRGTPYGQTYGPNGSWGRHNGEDWFAPTGTAVKAAFTGYVTTRWSETTGHVLEITDAEGKRILAGHLDRYAAGLKEAVDRAGGKLLVQQGAVLGYVGQTGSLAHKDLGPRNAHVHMMGYDAQGRIVDPLSQSYQQVQGPAWTNVEGDHAGGGDPNAKLKAALAQGKSLIAQYRLALASGDEVWQSKAYAALAYFKKSHQEVLGGLKDDFAGLNKDLDSRERAAAQRRAAARTSLESQLDRQLAAGKLDKAQATADKMRQQLDTELSLYKNNAAGRLRVEQELGPKVLAAQKRVLEAQRDQAVTAAQTTATQQRTALAKTYGKGKEPADLLRGIADTESAAIGVANSTFATKLSALYSASTERINTATAAVQSKDKQVAQQRLDTEKAVAQQLAGLNQEQRQAAVQRAQDELTTLQQTRQRRLDGAQGNASEILRIERDTAAGIQAAQGKLALTQLAAAKRLAEEQKAATIAGIPKGASDADRTRITQEAEAVRLGKVSSAYRAYSLAVTQAGDTATSSVQDAAQKQGQALDGLKGKYQDLITAFASKLLGDSLSDEEVTAFWADLNGLLKDAKASGLDLDPVIAGLRDRARELANSAPGVRAWSEEFAKAQQIAGTKYGDADLNAQYAMRGSYGVGKEGYKNALNGYGVLSVDELEGINPTAAKAMRAVYKEVLDQMLADQEKAAQESLNILDYYTAEGERISDNVATAADQSADEKNAQDAARVKALSGGGPGRMLEFLGGYGNDFFGDQFFTKLGTEGRAKFLEAFGKFSEDDLATLGQDTLSGVLGQIGDAPEWADLRTRLDAAYARAAQMRQEVDATLGDIYNNPDEYGDGGRGQTSKAPTSRFEELRGAIFGQAETLRSGTDNGIGDWLAGELDKAREAGQLTTAQLDLLKQTLAEIRAGGPIIAPNADDQRLDSWDKQLSTLIDDLNDGAISQEDFNEKALESVTTLGRLADAAERNEKPELAAKWRAYAAALVPLIQTADTATETLENLADAQASETTGSLLKLTESFQQGAIGQEDFNAQAVEGLLNLDKLGRAAQRANRPELVTYYRELAADLRKVGGEALATAEKFARLSGGRRAMNDARQGIEGLVTGDPKDFDTGWQQQLNDIQQAKKDFPELAADFDKLIAKGKAFKNLNLGYDFLNKAKLISNGVGQIANLLGEEGIGQAASALGQGFESAQGAAVGIAKVMANPADVGGWVQAITGVVGTIDSLFTAVEALDPAFAKWKKNQKEILALEQEGMGQKKYNGWLENPYYDTLQQDAANRDKRTNASGLQRWWWGITGGGPEVLADDVAQAKAKAGKIFADFAGDLASTAESALMDGWESGSFDNVADKMGQQLDRFVARLAIQTVMAKSNLSKLVENLSEEVARGGDTTDEVAAIKAELGKVSADAQAVLSALPGFGSGADGNATAASASSPVTGASFYVANSSKIDLFDDAITRADAMYGRVDAMFLRHEGVLTRTADVFERLLREGIRLIDSEGNLRGALR